MIPASRLAESARLGVEYLCEQQTAGGGFVSYIGSEVDDFETEHGHITTFAAALVLSALAELPPTESLEGLRERTAGFLREQGGSAGLYNYWPRESKESLERPYPDDLDVTACALAALYEYRPELVSPEQLAAVVRQLTVCEIAVGGPYYTWAVPPDAPEVWRDVDVGVNSNIAYFLAGQEVILPHLVELAEEAIRTGSYTTPYYMPSPYPVIYFIARFYRGPLLSELQRYLMDRRDSRGWWGNPQDSALAMSALLNTGVAAVEVERAAEALLGAQAGGSWPAHAMYVEFGSEAERQYAGAPALTTAFALEALAKYAAAAFVVPETERPQSRSEDLYQTVVGRVEQRFEELEGDLAIQASRALSRQLEGDNDRQVVLLSYYWESALVISGSPATYEELVVLGMANLYGWISYTIYDDFLDGEGEPAALSVANVAMRELMHWFGMLLPEDPGAALVVGVMGRIDAANTWEAVHCRGVVQEGRFSIGLVPDYGDFRWLAGRSLGHALGPLYLLLMRGCALDSVAMRKSLKFFTHYLIARQLNDDAHDWEEDLWRGQVNAVGALLLRGDLEGKKEGYEGEALEPLVGRLKKRLWEHEIGTVCDYIFRHVEAARLALEENPEIGDATDLLAMLEPLEGSAREAMQERSRATAFIKAYQGKKPEGEQQ